jgi:hypothetical protein
MRLSNGHSLLRQHENAVGIASGLPQRKGMAASAVAAVAASDVVCGRQVTELESFPRFFLFHFIFPFRCFGLPCTLVLRTHFWPFTEVMRKGRREVTRKVASGLRWSTAT